MADKLKPLSEIIAELQRFPPDSTIETVDGGCIIVYSADGRTQLGEVHID